MSTLTRISVTNLPFNQRHNIRRIIERACHGHNKSRTTVKLHNHGTQTTFQAVALPQYEHDAILSILNGYQTSEVYVGGETVKDY